MSDRALVVGIEQYASPFAKPLMGPALDALQFALMLRRTCKLDPTDILVVIEKCDLWSGAQELRYQGILQEVLAEQIKVTSGASRATIWNAWRNELPKGPKDPATLYFYWSGHGVAFPKDREAYLCSTMAGPNPEYIYLDEIRESFRTPEYSQFKRQWLVVDACANHIAYEALKMTSLTPPEEFLKRSEPDDQILLSAVPIGQRAKAEEGGSLFTRLLLDEVAKQGAWPTSAETLWTAVSKATLAQYPNLAARPRVQVSSHYLKTDLQHQEASIVHQVLEVLKTCGVSYNKYRPLYQRTKARIDSSDAFVPDRLPEMVESLAAGNPEVLYGGMSRGLAEFLVRVERQFPGPATANLTVWLNRKEGLPQGGRLTIEQHLDREHPDLTLAILVEESRKTQSELPASVKGLLCDASFTSTVESFPLTIAATRPELEAVILEIFLKAHRLAKSHDAALNVYILANPPLMDVPYHAISEGGAPQDFPAKLGELTPFVMRSRGRLLREDGYELDAWKTNVAKLRGSKARLVAHHPAPSITEDVRDVLAKLKGILLFGDSLGPPGTPRSDTHRLLDLALRRGLPLVSWRVGAASPADQKQWIKELKALFKTDNAVPSMMIALKDSRRQHPWARQTALLWDDDEDASHLRDLLKELKEPDQFYGD